MQAIQWSAHVTDGRKGGRYSVAYISLQIISLLCYTLASILVLSIGIARGQYYWVLGALLGTVLTLLTQSCTILANQ